MAVNSIPQRERCEQFGNKRIKNGMLDPNKAKESRDNCTDMPTLIRQQRFYTKDSLLSDKYLNPQEDCS